MHPVVRRLAPTLVLVLACLTPASATGLREDPGAAEPQRLRMATTTSTENSGLLAVLLPPFEERYNVVVDVIAVGTGQALQLGRNGDVDLVMVHAPALEAQFVAEGYGVERVGFMYNDFVLLGPLSDPAGVAGTSDVAEAFRRIASSGSRFISRGDNSGTHAKEGEIWAAAGITERDDWYREAGQGMGAVITVANNDQAYTLADRGTYLAYLSEVDLQVAVEGDPLLFNPYAAIAVSPERHAHVRVDLAQALIDFLVSPEGQEIIGGYLINGRRLFTPDA